MLRLLRLIFGTIALAWLALWLVGLIAFAVSPKAVGASFSGLIRFNYVGAPACLIWAVLKVVSVLKASRAERPVSLVAWTSPAGGTAGAGGVLNAPPAAPLPETRRIDSSSPTTAPQPEVYTYSAPGVPLCPQCGERPAIFHCLTHRQAVCLQCVAKHDQEAECFYVPAFRALKSDGGQGTRR